MLRRILPIIIALVLTSVAQNSSAQWITGTDTAYTDKFVGFNIPDLMFVSGRPDNKFATFEKGNEAYFYFRPGPQTEKTFPIKPGAKVTVYGKQDPSIDPDSSGIFLSFDGAASTIPSQRYYINSAVTEITVPDTLYTSITLSMQSIDEDNDIVNKLRFYVDAIKLEQKFDPLWVRRSDDGKIASAYPNPFLVQQSTKLNFSTKKYADVSLLVMDIAGREVNRIDVGPRPAGDQQIELNVPDAGIFMVQLMLDGVPAGKVVNLHAR